MNAKELRSAAEYTVTMWDNHYSKRLVAGEELFFNSDGEPDSVTFARHILATVLDDDDEPVTPERLVELGGLLLHGEGEYGRVVFNRENANRIEFWIYSSGIYVEEEFQEEFPIYLVPRNMKEARELLVRCGAIKEEANDE